ncbi:MAG: HalOD1 output domain-containing protein [Haloarculaceae archaeon]
MSDDALSNGGREPDRPVELISVAEADGRDSPSEAVVRAVAAVSDRRPDALEPLYDAVDPDALDALCASTPDDTARDALTVEFRYGGYDVAVDGDGSILVYGPASAES